MDLKIAAIVLANGATLLSRNLSDFRKVPGLKVEDWTLASRDLINPSQILSRDLPIPAPFPPVSP